MKINKDYFIKKMEDTLVYKWITQEDIFYMQEYTKEWECNDENKDKIFSIIKSRVGKIKILLLFTYEYLEESNKEFKEEHLEEMWNDLWDLKPMRSLIQLTKKIISQLEIIKDMEGN